MSVRLVSVMCEGEVITMWSLLLVRCVTSDSVIPSNMTAL